MSPPYALCSPPLEAGTVAHNGADELAAADVAQVEPDELARVEPDELARVESDELAAADVAGTVVFPQPFGPARTIVLLGSS